VKGWKSLR